jgi:uncharacterized membrane protein
MNTTADRAVEKYLKRLDADLADVPRSRRREIVEEIAEHIAEARADLPAENEAETRTLLERLGDPADIAAEARQRFEVEPVRPGWMETATLVLLLVGGFTFFGWFIGLALLCSSAVWTTRDKLIGTFLVPGGLALPLFLFVFWAADSSSCIGQIDPSTGRTINEMCTGGASGASRVLAIILLILLVAAAVFTTAYLATRMRRHEKLATA